MYVSFGSYFSTMIQSLTCVNTSRNIYIHLSYKMLDRVLLNNYKYITLLYIANLTKLTLIFT